MSLVMGRCWNINFLVTKLYNSVVISMNKAQLNPQRQESNNNGLDISC